MPMSQDWQRKTPFTSSPPIRLGGGIFSIGHWCEHINCWFPQPSQNHNASLGGIGVDTDVDVEGDDLSANSDSDEEEEPTEPTAKRWKKNYDKTRKFQLEWSAKLPWAEGVLLEDGRLHMVRCRACTAVDGREKLLAPKWDTLCKHEGRQWAQADNALQGVKKGDVYFLKSCHHALNMAVFAAKKPISILQQVNKFGSLERRKKKVQFASLFHLLSAGRPMSQYESLEDLFSFLDVPNFPYMHWSDSSGCIMAEFMFDVVKAEIKAEVSSAPYVALTCDETTTVDNGSWMSIHAYTCQNWVRVPFLIGLEKVVDAPTADHFTALLLQALERGGGIDAGDIARKLLCFGADGVTVFQGTRTGITVQLQQKVTPFSIGVHCAAHRVNLAAKTLSVLTIFQNSEKLMVRIHAFFNHSPKRLVEFQKLAEIMETKGLRPLKNVATRWVSLLEPLRRLLGEYRTLMAKMHADRAASADARVSTALIFFYFLFVNSFFFFFFFFVFFFFSLILSA
jgi:hypothetical protein